MADKKISQLTGATIPLAGTEVLPIVQSGSTTKVSVANLTAGRDMAAKSIALTDDLAVTDGGTGASSASAARSNLSAAASGANSDITSLTGLTTSVFEVASGYAMMSKSMTYINGSVDVATIAFNSGGFEIADIFVTATVSGDRGVRRTHVTYQGYSAISPTQIVAAADVYSGGSTPPSISFTASTGSLKISVGSNASLSGAIAIEVMGTRASTLTALV